MKVQFGKIIIRVFFLGIVDDIIIEQGMVVSVGQILVICLVNLNDMYISVEILEVYLGSVLEGKDVEVFFLVFGDMVSVRVRQVGNYINLIN